MARVLVISSMVARGHVGLSAIVPVLQGLGFETVALPTVLLSNHPGHPCFAGRSVPVSELEAMLSALGDNGWLRDLDAVLTGYFPSVAHVNFGAAAIRRLRDENAGALICCDPVLGDDPTGLYVAEEVANAVRAELLPLSDAITPNRFELEWLCRQPVTSPADAVVAARSLGVPLTLVTSVPAGQHELANVAVSRDEAWQALAARLQGVPHGTGDVLSAAFLAARLSGLALPAALATSVARVSVIIAASVGADELHLVASRANWLDPFPAEATPL